MYMRKLEERLLYNKVVRNIHTEFGKKGRKLAGWDPCLWEGTQRKRKVTQVEILPAEWVVWATLWAPQSWCLTQGMCIPLAGWRAGRTNMRLPLWGAYMCLLAPESGWRGQIDIARVADWFPTNTLAYAPTWDKQTFQSYLLHAPHWTRVAKTEKRAQLWYTEVAYTWSDIWAGQGKPLLVLTQEVHQKKPWLLSTAGPLQPTPPHTPTAYMGNSCPVTKLHTRAGKCDRGWGERSTLMGKGGSDLKWPPNGTKAAITGACTGST